MTCESDCCEITSQDANMAEELNSAQEEVDTRLILYAAHAAVIHIFRLIVHIYDVLLWKPFRDKTYKSSISYGNYVRKLRFKFAVTKYQYMQLFQICI